MYVVRSKQARTAKFFWTTANIEFIGEDGTRSIHKMKVKFKVPEQTALSDYRKAFADSTISDAQFLADVTLGWEGVVDEDKNLLEFTPENFANALEDYPTQPTLVNTFFNNINDAVRKN